MFQELPILTVTHKGRVVVRDRNGQPIPHFAGLAFDAICQMFVWIDPLRRLVAFLVSETLSDAQCEIEYLESKFQ